MKIAVVGKGLQAYVAATLFASVGNDVVLFDRGQYYDVVMKEPGLERLFKTQQDASRLNYMASVETDNKIYDFVLLAETSPAKMQSEYYQQLLPSINSGGCFIILTPSEIGEARDFSELLQQTSESVVVCCVPLLVREGRALDDFSRPESILVGCDNEQTLPKIRNLFYPFNRNKDVIKVVSTKEAEFSSFATLAMLATRLSFMNEMASLAERCEVDIDVVRECIGSDPRIGRDYLYPGCGYGGKVLAENVDKIARKLQLRSDDLGLLNIVAKINERQKDLLFRKIWSFYKGEIKHKTIAIWGASFKPGSSSIAGAPAIKLIESLLAQSARVKVYDPIANDNLRTYFNGAEGLSIVDDVYAAIDSANVLAICTEWKEFWSPDFNKLKNALSEQAIFDGRNILEPKQVKAHGLIYFGVGRGEKI